MRLRAMMEDLVQIGSGERLPAHIANLYLVLTLAGTLTFENSAQCEVISFHNGFLP